MDHERKEWKNHAKTCSSIQQHNSLIPRDLDKTKELQVIHYTLPNWLTKRAEQRIISWNKVAKCYLLSSKQVLANGWADLTKLN